MAKKMVILDTNILIELYKGDQVARSLIQNFAKDDICISAITAAEFMVGAKDKADFKRISKYLDEYIYLPIDIETTDVFMGLFNEYSLSHRPGIADTLIAATALRHDIPLLTYNKRHFQYIPGITLV